jgi:nucleotide-binding universal stress UspA family protein
MITRIVLPIDANMSPGTRLALQAAGELVALSPPDVCLYLLHVIPVPYVSSRRWGVYRLQPTSRQRAQAEESLLKARSALREHGVCLERIELLVSHGTPAEEIVEFARGLDAGWIVMGSQGRSTKQRIRRLFAGSTSRQVLRHAPCPVLMVSPSQILLPCNLVTWYKQAITHSLQDHPGGLRVFTPDEVARTFAPPDRVVGHKEVEAASRALEQLSQEGMLCCHTVAGQLCYVND